MGSIYRPVPGEALFPRRFAKFKNTNSGLFFPFKICYSGTGGTAALKIKYRKAGAGDVEVLSQLRVDMLSADNGLSEAAAERSLSADEGVPSFGPKRSNLFFLYCRGGMV